MPNPLDLIWIIPLCLIGLLLVIVLIRTALFKPKKQEKPEIVTFDYDKNTVIDNLAEMVKCKTISSRDKNMEDEQEFTKFVDLLPKLFPLVHKNCKLEHFGERGLLYTWKGKSSQDPSVFMSHYDVVSIGDGWTQEAFDAHISNNELWGRGTLDTKATLNGVLNSAEILMKQGFVPNNDVYFAFAGNEEIAGPDAVAMVENFLKNKVSPKLVVDEGGAVVQDMFPGVKEPCALIGTAEKGMLDIEYVCGSKGGHASSPPPHTTVGVLSRACVNVEAKPFKSKMAKPVAEMFDTLGRHSTFVFRMIFANLWLFRPVLDAMCKRKGGELNALMRTTVAFTQMEGSKGSNVLAPKAKMVSNSRIITGETVESAVAYITKCVNNPDISITPSSYSMDPSIVSKTGDALGWKKVTSAIEQTWPEAIVSPYLMVACSDSRHYGKISQYVYRFSAMALSSDERKRIHGDDERIPLETITKVVDFYLRVMSQC